jgi:hypothetical protein
MPFGVRVSMTPLESGLGQPGQRVFDGAIISLMKLGSPPSELEIETPVSAKLSLTARYIESIRKGGEETTPLAELEGELLLGKEQNPRLRFRGKLGADGKPVGLVAAEPIGEDEELPADDPREIRLLRFAFDSATFADVVEAGKLSELLTPIDAARFDYCEISVKLEIAGATEAPETADDVLDVLITARNPARSEIVTVRLTDELGEPMAGATLRILAGGKPAEPGADPDALVADGNGEVRLKTVAGSPSCRIAWGPSAGDLRFERSLFLDMRGGAEEADERRLRNLGYIAGESVEEDVLAFQTDLGRDGSGRLRDVTADLEAIHDEGVKPERGEPAEPSKEAVAVNGPRNPGVADQIDPQSSVAVA